MSSRNQQLSWRLIVFETHDSSLSQIYDHNSAYFNDQHQDLKVVTTFQAVSTNSGSEVDDSASIPRAHLTFSEFTGTHSIESSANEFAFSSCPMGSLSLVVTTQISEKAIINTSAIKEIYQQPEVLSFASVGHKFGMTQHRRNQTSPSQSLATVRYPKPQLQSIT
ncbi:hypothetical protein F8388_022690 [Cannabis sativa]|uniref:Uncharacterized protein n=1 Tax=Cannabis sativa TaxID=3483 RepID=A0A7J6G1V3_CANSA|nr:hypothetical protein F8388_022690 [Cannabis sativa]